ncbi:MAG: single-stranded-DNA-specific exonuclease RecJ [Bacillota bacterium]|nr:MAG: single-stranded-DNA-specific exonuclease RecJ [Bacillota bacterium]
MTMDTGTNMDTSSDSLCPPVTPRGDGTGADLLRPASPWRLVPVGRGVAEHLAGALDLHPVAARVLAARGITEPDQAGAFLNPRLDQLGDPFAMYGMDRAVERILAAAARREKVLVYGDYDVDGLCAAAILVQALERLGIDAGVYIPHRVREGYGLHAGPLEEAARQGVSLVITVDTGISAAAEARRAAQLGLDLIITDHHELPPELPPALAVLHPRHPAGRYPFPYLSGAGVAWRLVDALAARLDRRSGAGAGLDPESWLDLAALAAVADVMPLVGHNRVLVSRGLERLRAAPRAGVAALCRVAGVDPASIDTRAVGFALAPRLNAAGRMGDARVALDLLTAASAAAAEPLARVLDTENRTRQQVQEAILRDARDRAARYAGRVVVLSDPGWHPGVVGIVAAKLCEELGRPVLLGRQEGGVVQGSARSHPGFDITEALSRCSDLLEAYGGHALAAGFRLASEALPELARRLDALYRSQVGDSAPAAPLLCDAEVTLDQVDERLAGDLARMEPFGEGNPEPLLWLRDATLAGARPVGRDGSHLRLRLGGGGRLVDAIAFGRGHLAARLVPAEPPGRRYGPRARLAAWDAPAPSLEAAVRVARSAWSGRPRLELHVEDLRPAPAAREARETDGPVPPGAGTAPAADPAVEAVRSMLAGLYRALRRLVGAPGAPGAVALEQAVDLLSGGTGLSPRDVRRGLDVFREVGLLEVDREQVRLLPVAGKVDLERSTTFRRMAASWHLQQGIDP